MLSGIHRQILRRENLLPNLRPRIPLPNHQTDVSQQSEGEELKVFISNRESVCGECHENLGSNAWITLAGDKGALCLACADLDHLLFLPSRNTALTRRARKHSTPLAGESARWQSTPAFKYSGRIGRSGSAKAMDEGAVRLAVIAQLRHRETDYDELLAKGRERWEARAEVDEALHRVLQRWETAT